jgi:hypothetical protein
LECERKRYSRCFLCRRFYLNRRKLWVKSLRSLLRINWRIWLVLLALLAIISGIESSGQSTTWMKWRRRDCRALLIIDVDTRTSNSSYTKTAISSKYSPGFSRRCSHRTLSIGGVIDRGLPPLFEGAFVVPK